MELLAAGVSGRLGPAVGRLGPVDRRRPAADGHAADPRRQGGRRRHPAAGLPHGIRPIFERMGGVAADLADRTEPILRTRDIEPARELDPRTARWYDLHAEMFSA